MTRPAAPIGPRASIPNPALQPLAVLVGRWRTEGSHGLLPGVTLHGNASFEWIEHGAFLLMRSEVDHPSVPQGIAIFGSDDVQHTFFMLYFDERGVSRIQHVSLEQNVLKWWRDQPGFSQRSTTTIASDGKTMISQGELCRDGITWEKDLELTYTRVVQPAYECPCAVFSSTALTNERLQRNLMDAITVTNVDGAHGPAVKTRIEELLGIGQQVSGSGR